MDLKKQSVNGAIWTFIDILINKGAYFISTIVLASILGPKEFGLLGMIMLFVAIGNTLIDSGMSTSLLRSNIVSELEYSTVFITNLLMSVLVYFILFFSAPFIADFYDQTILTHVIRWYCLGFIITSFRSIHNVKLMKELDFKKITFLNLPGNFFSALISIWMGYEGYGIWSLVALFLINQIISSVVFWVFIKWKPLFKFDFENYKNHFKFGYKLIISAQLNTIFENIYNILIGKYYSLQTLGFYERANTFNFYPISVLTGGLMKVSLPSLVLIKDDLERLQNAYKKMMQMGFFLSLSGLAFAAFLAPQIVSLVLGSEWMPIVPLFQILSAAYVFYPIHSLNINILSLFGRSDLFLKLEIFKKIIILIIVLICFKFGVLGLVWSNVINSVIALFINTYFSGKFLNYSTSSQLKDLLPTMGVVLLTIGLVYILEITINPSNIILQIIMAITVGLLIMIFISEKVKLTPYIYIKELIFDQIKK